MSSRGRFVWHDLMTTDTQAAEAFYTTSLGWGTGQWKGGGMEGMPPYTMLKAEGENNYIGGLMPLPDEAKAMGAQPHWIAYIAVEDVDATVERAKSLGAQIYSPPMDIPDVGRFAILADPQGAVFAPFQPATSESGSDGPAGIGEFSWHELATTDWKAAWSFYSELFGWEMSMEMEMGEMGTYFMFRRPGTEKTLGGMFNKPAEMPAPPNWLPYVHVKDINSTVAAIKENGGQVLNGPMEVPGGDLVAVSMDPQGAAFAVHAFASK